MVWSARIPMMRKLALIGSKSIPLTYCVNSSSSEIMLILASQPVFCGGLITAVAGILRCTLVRMGRPDGPELAGAWSCRESFIAVFISNLPVIYPILYRAFKSMKTSAYSHSRSQSQAGLGASENGKNGVRFKMGTMSARSTKREKFQHPLSLPGDTFYTRFGSEEDIFGSDKSDTKSIKSVKTLKSEKKRESTLFDNHFSQVTVTREVEVRNSVHDSLRDSEEGSGHGNVSHAQ